MNKNNKKMMRFYQNNFFIKQTKRNDEKNYKIQRIID